MYTQTATILAVEAAKLLWNLGRQFVVFAYIGPETIMPLASILGAIAGFVLVFRTMLTKLFKRLSKTLFKSANDRQPQSSTSQPSSEQSANDAHD